MVNLKELLSLFSEKLPKSRCTFFLSKQGIEKTNKNAHMFPEGKALLQTEYS